MTTTLLNRSSIRAFALRQAEVRGHKFTRVSKDFYDRIDRKLREIIAAEIHSMPSAGATIR
jgi:hypothetical protein